MDAFGVIGAETSVEVGNRYNIAPSEPPPERRIHTRETNYASPDDPAERRPAGDALGCLAAHPGLDPGRRAEIRHRERTLRDDGEATGLSARVEFGQALLGAGHLVHRVADGRGQPPLATLARLFRRPPADGVCRLVGGLSYRRR